MFPTTAADDKSIRELVALNDTEDLYDIKVKSILIPDFC